MPPIEPTTPEPSPPAEDPGYELLDDADDWTGPLPIARPADRRLARAVRGFLVVIAVVLAGVFGVAAWIHPYDAAGNPKSMATHTQLGLPPCNMVELVGKPCPACGMTTSFSLLVHGDVANSLRANWVGTLLAAFWLALIPWAVASAVRGRYLFIRSAELFTTAAVSVLLVLMLGRWVIVLVT